MIVRVLKKSDIPQCRTLWTERFGDSDSFLDWYFADRFTPDHSFGLFDSERLLSQAHGRPMQMMLGGKPKRALMIGGVSTKVGCEKQGFMHKVLKALEQHAQEAGFDFLFLATENPPIYTSSGFTVCCNAKYATGHNEDTVISFDSVSDMTDELAACYESAMNGFDFAPIRSRKEMSSRAEELCSDGAVLILDRYSDKVTGYAFYNPGSKSAEEVMASDFESYCRLLDRLPLDATCILPPNISVDGEVTALCMWKPLNVAVRSMYEPANPSFCPETF